MILILIKTMIIYKFENSSKKIQNIFQKCKEASIKSNLRSKHSACIVKNGKIIVLEHNKYAKTGDHNYSVHAECCVYKKFRNLMKLNKIKKRYMYKLYVIRYSKATGYMNSKPCKCCTKMIKQISNINKVYYSNDNNTYICEDKNNLKTDHVSIGFLNKNKK